MHVIRNVQAAAGFVMSDPKSLDPLAILASLGITDNIQARPLNGGFDTGMWRVCWRDQPYALRVFRPQQASVCEREVAVMQAASGGGIPVPQVIRQGMHEAYPVLLLSWVKGRMLRDELFARPHLFWRLGTAFGRMQAAVHAISAPAHIDSTAWIEWAGDEPELKARLYDLPARASALLHLDYHPLNVMADGGQITGVLDWANARAGDPRADFARTYTILRVEPITPIGDHAVLAVMRRLLERAWRTGYTQAGGRLDDMALFYAWAGAAMIRDLSPRAGKPGFWLQDQHLDGVRAWRDQWKRRAGIR
jgi:aminoglycoside phosphotransferase (APT) family kinase protein